MVGIQCTWAFSSTMYKNSCFFFFERHSKSTCFPLLFFLVLTFGMLLCSLVQWLKHSRKEYCELCKHRFAFTPSEYTCDTDGSPTLIYPTTAFRAVWIFRNHNCFCWSIKNIRQCLQLAVHLSFFSLLPGHALTSAHPGHLCWLTDQCGNSHPLLVPLHTGGLRVARGGSSHSM